MSVDREFLPQYAAQAVAAFEMMAEKGRQAFGTPGMMTDAAARFPNVERDLRALMHEADFMARMIRASVHVVLPHNGEVYAPTYPMPMPTQDEVDSLEGLPAPCTTFEFPTDQDAGVTKILVVVVDAKQAFPDEDLSGLTVFFARFEQGVWVCPRNAVFFGMPLHFVKAEGGKFAVTGRGFRIAPHLRPDDVKDQATVMGAAMRALLPVIQCCHALRAGASLDERTEGSANRRWKMEKKGVGGFTYHVLKLPERAVRHDESLGGSHASPRFHVRRAHIRKLPSGVLTFVRQCFVGDRERGIVEKSYQMATRPPDPARAVHDAGDSDG